MKVPVTQEALDELKTKAAESLGCKPEDITTVHVSPSYTPCDHDWNAGQEPSHCVKCGMSFTRYIFTEW